MRNGLQFCVLTFNSGHAIFGLVAVVIDLTFELGWKRWIFTITFHKRYKQSPSVNERHNIEDLLINFMQVLARNT